MDLGKLYVEDVASSLVREYLSRKGLRSTLEILDEELPRTPNSIGNRQLLMKEMKLEKLMKKNKELDVPLRTMIEVITKFFIERNAQSFQENCSSNKRDMSLLPIETEPKGMPSVTQNLQPDYSTKTTTTDYPSIATVTSRNHSSQKAISSIVSPPLRDCTKSASYTTASDRDTFVSKTRTAVNSKSACNSNKSDILIDDDLDSETLVGSGKSGVFFNTNVADQVSRTRFTRPNSSRARGLAAPITSNIDESQRRRSYQKQKPWLSGSHAKSNGSNHHSPKATELTEFNTVSKQQYQQEPASSPKPEPTKRPVSITDVIEKSSERLNELARRQSEPLIDDEQSYSVAQSSMANERPASRAILLKGKEETTSGNDVEFSDVGDVDNELNDLQLGPITHQTQILNLNKLDFKPIDLQTAASLKNIILGSANETFVDEWRYQSFSFCDIPELQFGIVQKKGGPCGVLAAVQACILQEMLFGDDQLPKGRSLQPTCEERSFYLATALSQIFWRAGSQHKAVVTVPSGRSHIIGSSQFKTDDLTEMLMLYKFTKYEELLSFMRQTVPQFEMDGNGGIILSLYSAVLSRGVQNVKSDLDETEGKLMAAHFYCTQEIVNLYLTGRAVSNVFNDVVELDSGGGSVTILKGIHQRSNIGFLSLFEHYKSCQVGTFYKTPKYPIWVVCSESHFSVLFSTNQALTSDWKAERRFTLHYYDGLARQQEDIQLSMSTTNRSFIPSDGDLVPPLEHCIRTKWKDAEVDWNGYEPIL